MADPDGIYHWHRLDARTTTSGQPTETELADLAALGVGHVINLGPYDPARALADEGASVAALGMGYTYIPVDFQNPTDADFERFCAAITAVTDVPLHVHCYANYRVSAFFYRYRRDVLGEDAALAQVDLDKIWEPNGAWVRFLRPAINGEDSA